MTGVMLALQGVLSSTASVAWANIVGSLEGSNNDQTMPYTTTITLSLSSVIGSGAMYYVKNGASPVAYSGPFSVTLGDTLHWVAQSKGTYSATATVTRTGSILVDTFTVSLS